MNFIKLNKRPIILSVLHTAVIYICTVLLIKNIYNFFEKGSDMYYIFQQLQSAKIVVPCIITLIVFFFLYKLMFKINLKKGKIVKIIFFSLLLFFITLIALILSTLLSIVNNVVFLDILISLIKNMEALGIWEKLLYILFL